EPMIFHPEGYHGRRAKPPFFEGWYVKLDDPGGERTLAVIPGIYLGEDPASRHAFIQATDGRKRWYARYPVEAFEGATDRFDVRVGTSRFHAGGMTLDLDAPEGRLAGEVRFENPVPWPVTWRSPGIMGWYAWVPTMECYHGVVSLDHGLSGSVQIDGEAVDFSGGRGYTEKDWGRRFPRAWVWMQTNGFEGHAGTSLTASIARIPWWRTTFPGFIVGFWHAGTLYRFATYTGAETTRLHVTDEDVEWSMKSRNHVLEITARRAPGAELLGPRPEGMVPVVEETVSASVHVRLTTAAGDVVFDGTGHRAGLEVVSPESIF
ncbi:MAG: tocopherol cyclase family protein, partial [Bacteroidota bacterium]